MPMSLFHKLRSRPGRVLFACLGNSCRSQVAEAFARAYAGDVIEAASAGVLPASRISRTTRTVMEERGVPFQPDQTPKNILTFDLDSFDLIVNLSEYALPNTKTQVLKWPVADPIRQPEEAHREMCDQIDELVRFLAEHFRRAREWNLSNPLYSEECALASSSA
jgi:arsenate reductase